MPAYRSSFGARESLLLSGAPLPVAASFDLGTNGFVVVFDKELVSGVQPPNGWFAVIAGLSRTAVGDVLVDGNVVSGTMNVIGTNPLSDRISYGQLPGNLVGVNGLEVESFDIVPFVDVPVPLKAEYDVVNDEVIMTFNKPVFVNTAIKSDFQAVFVPNTLTVQFVGIGDPNEVVLDINVDGPGSVPSRVNYNGKVDGIEDASGNDVPLFVIGLDLLP